MDVNHMAEMKALSREMEPNQSPAQVMGKECQNLGLCPLSSLNLRLGQKTSPFRFC